MWISGATIIPKDLKCGDVMLHSLWARRHGTKNTVFIRGK